MTSRFAIAFCLVATFVYCCTASAAAEKRPLLAIVISEPEYHTDVTLPDFVRHHLATDFRTTFIIGSKTDGNDLPGIEAIADADVLLLSVRRRSPPKAQLDAMRKFVADGKPLVGIRTASHAFVLGGNEASPAGHDQWPDFDQAVLGGNYHGHYPAAGPNDPQTFAWVSPDAAQHPILRGIPGGEFVVHSTLYKNSPLPAGAQVLMLGRSGDTKPDEPVAWTHLSPAGGRVFYTSLGGPEDFKDARFERLLANGVYWAAGLNVPAEPVGVK